MNGGTIFDDIIITDNKAEADDFAKMWKALTMHEAPSLQIFKKKDLEVLMLASPSASSLTLSLKSRR